ncbi:unnamed protein product [Fraxinus pennsylvanica]|uniref:Uncharacterized protein n=1 Tax=Fraxinus pennsylvanica TaxID=56036 RepID=A0AAD2DFX1_9LAMI|nr:unnamed protein product [Fraxinus pennsylvanica]
MLLLKIKLIFHSSYMISSSKNSLKDISYFGNAIQGGAATATPNDLLSNGLGWAAQQLNQMIAAKTLEETKNNYENWLKCPRLSMKGARTNTFVVGSSPQFNVYGNDFGWGNPWP